MTKRSSNLPFLAARALLVVSAFASLIATAAESTGWEKVIDEPALVTYRRPLGNDGIVGFRGEATIDAGIEDVVAVMEDNTIAKDWMPMVADRRDLRILSTSERIERTRMSLPWPVTDRYFIDKGRRERLPDGSVRFTVESVADPDPAWLQPDLVLGKFHKSEFLLTPLAGGRGTRLVFELNTEAGGHIPLWLVNLAQRNWPRDFVDGLVEQVQKAARKRAQPHGA